ncbi:MAG: TIGR02757 family protein [Clostridium sp.]|nr:TIGR02757 family protein [Clostridium sp.]
MVDADLKRMLLEEAARIDSPEFIGEDPVQFPRMFEDARDIEIASLLCSTIAWGNRKMICRSCQKMLSLMDMQPYRYMMDEGYEDLPDQNIHRTFFAKNLRHYLRGLRRIYSAHGSLQGFAHALGIASDQFPAWKLVEGINRELCLANDGLADSRCLPQNTENTALKRVNMALRWLVRKDGIVDLGIWDVITPAQLYIPLDVHVAQTSRNLGLLQRRSNDRRAVAELTDTLREVKPDDPVYLDYALFGIGMNL